MYFLNRFRLILHYSKKSPADTFDLSKEYAGFGVKLRTPAYPKHIFEFEGGFIMYRKSKKIKVSMVSLIVLIMTLSVLAGCALPVQDITPTAGPSVPTSVPPVVKETVKWMVWGSSAGWEAKINLLNETYPEYAEKYDIQVEVGGKGDVEVSQKLRLALSANTDVPDIVQFNYGGMLGFASMGVLEDLTGFMAPYKNELLAGALKLVTFQDKVIGFPVALKSKLWYYRKDLFDQAGIDPAQVKTEDDFINAGKKLKEKFPDSRIWNIGPNIAGYDLGMVLSGNGGKFFDEKGNYIVSEDPGVRKAFSFFKRLVDEDIVLNISDFTPDWERAFADSSLASTLNASWFAGNSYLPVYAPDQAGKWAVTQWPEVAGSTGGSDSGGALSCIPGKSAHKNAAMDILQRITFDPALRQKIFEVQPEQLPLTTAGMQEPIYNKTNPYFGDSLAAQRLISLDGDHFKLFNYSPASSLEFTLMNQYLNIYLSGNQSLDEILASAEKDLKSQIGNPLEYTN